MSLKHDLGSHCKQHRNPERNRGQACVLTCSYGHEMAANACMVATTVVEADKARSFYVYGVHVELSCLLRYLDSLEMQLCLHSFKQKPFQKLLIGNIALVGQRLELIQ